MAGTLRRRSPPDRLGLMAWAAKSEVVDDDIGRADRDHRMDRGRGG